MTMFEELYELATGATLTMVLSADEKTGRMTNNVIPEAEEGRVRAGLAADARASPPIRQGPRDDRLSA